MSRFYNDYDGQDDLLFMDSYLEHHGVKGMKWGQHLPEVLQRMMLIGKYQGKSRAQANAIVKRRKARKAAVAKKAQTQRRRQESLAKARATAKKNAPRRKELDKIAMSGDSKTILQNYNEMSDKQRRTALNQLQMKSSIENIRATEIKNGFQKVDSTLNTLGNAAVTANKVIQAVGAGHNLVSALTSTREKEKSPEDTLTEMMLKNSRDIGKHTRKETGSDLEGDKAMQDAMLRVVQSGIVKKKQQ